MKKYYKKDNQIIYNCDNLELLKSLPDNSINLIYSDILYNTGKDFNDYNDNLGSPKEAIEWYRPRMIEMKRVLKENGSIFIHCNWRLDSYLRVLMDEVFGLKSYRNTIYRKFINERGLYRDFDSQVDTILYYVKNPNDFVFNEIRDNKKRLFPLFEHGYIKNQSESFEVGEYKIELPEKTHCIFGNFAVQEIYKNGELVVKNGLPYRYSNVKPISNVWLGDEMLDNYSHYSSNSEYDTPKPLIIIETIIKMCSNENDVVADFFLGGGSTAVAAKKLHRKGIYCDINSKACNITIARLENEDLSN